MKIYSINSVTPQRQPLKHVTTNHNYQTNNVQPTFKSTGGKIVGGLLGAGFTGLLTIATIATTGPAAALVLLAAETGGALGGGALGHALTGKDDD